MKANTITAAPCPSCGHSLTRVQLVARIEQGALRRRVCKSCAHRFYTLQPHEVVISQYEVSWRSGLAPRSIPELRGGWDTLAEAFGQDAKTRIAAAAELEGRT